MLKDIFLFAFFRNNKEWDAEAFSSSNESLSVLYIGAALLFLKWTFFKESRRNIKSDPIPKYMLAKARVSQHSCNVTSL